PPPHEGAEKKDTAHDFMSGPQLVAGVARTAHEGARGESEWRRYFQSCDAHRHTGAARATARLRHKERCRSRRKRDGDWQTWRNFACSALARRIGPRLRFTS